MMLRSANKPQHCVNGCASRSKNSRMAGNNALFSSGNGSSAISKKTAGMSVEAWLDALARLAADILRGEGAVTKPPLSKLAEYYTHLAELAKGYEKDTIRLQENLRHVYGWRDEVEQLEKMLT